jgi:hypothetical protein
MIPAGLKALRRDRIVIGWTNTRASRRAVTDALPLLRAAGQVMVVQIEDSAEAVDPWDGLNGVVDRLAGHGMSATGHTLAKAMATSPGP